MRTKHKHTDEYFVLTYVYYMLNKCRKRKTCIIYKASAKWFRLYTFPTDVFVMVFASAAYVKWLCPIEYLSA